MNEIKLNELSQKAHNIAIKQGFWNNSESVEHHMCMVITEVCEAVQADREKNYHDIRSYQEAKDGHNLMDKLKRHPQKDAFEKYMKDTVEDEMADVVIYLCDLAGDQMIDFTKMSKVNYYRAFGRWDFAENAFALIKGLTQQNVNINRRILFGLTFVVQWAKYIGFDLEYAVNEKMEYNKTREYKNGKQY